MSLHPNWLTFSGAGPIGLVTLLACRAAGAAPIVITDLFQSRLDFAKKLVPNVRTVCIDKSWNEEEVSKRIREVAGGPVKVAMECTGFESSIRAAVYVRLVLSSALTPVCQVWRQGLRYWRRGD